ncbi:MAG TPA: deoxyribonuclease IV [Longimicrobiales bacterium]|nr:deoxyribonuclease IV [Longimicrobiales bacterium]
MKRGTRADGAAPDDALETAPADELGAHVSIAGGTPNAPLRATEIGARVIQMFTKQANRWAEREVEPEEAQAFQAAREAAGITHAASHDSYLINLATADDVLFRRSLESFTAELRRSEALGLDFAVTHPGNATDGDAARGIRRNAEAIADALDAVPGRVRVLLEGTAGSGTALGASFEELGELLGRIGERHPDRIGVCLDTCHLWAARYDLRALDDVLEALESAAGLRHLRFLHLNDSATPFGSRRDRHAGIGEGTIGPEPFTLLVRHPALRPVPKVIETPKGEDAVTADRANLARLRGYRSSKKGA